MNGKVLIIGSGGWGTALAIILQKFFTHASNTKSSKVESDKKPIHISAGLNIKYRGYRLFFLKYRRYFQHVGNYRTVSVGNAFR